MLPLFPNPPPTHPNPYHHFEQVLTCNFFLPSLECITLTLRLQKIKEGRDGERERTRRRKLHLVANTSWDRQPEYCSETRPRVQRGKPKGRGDNTHPISRSQKRIGKKRKQFVKKCPKNPYRTCFSESFFSDHKKWLEPSLVRGTERTTSSDLSDGPMSHSVEGEYRWPNQ